MIFGNDSIAIDKQFYYVLLHISGAFNFNLIKINDNQLFNE